jgi:hypothetical protein
MIKHKKKIATFTIATTLLVGAFGAISTYDQWCDTLPIIQLAPQKSIIEGTFLEKPASERAAIKSDSIAGTHLCGTYEDKKYGVKVEVKSIKDIGGGVEIMARAWKDGKQLGFGEDGSVDIERFQIVNPPILVDDPNGTIVREEVSVVTKEIERRTLREDFTEAIKQTLVRIAKAAGVENSKIIPGKVGHTTTTCYPDADPESTSVDGEVSRDVAAAGEIFSTMRTSAGTSAGPTTSATAVVLEGGTTSNQFRGARRLIHLYDCSAIPDTDTITSAKESLYVYSADTSNGLSGQASANSAIVVGSSNPASNTNLVAGDYNIAVYGTTEFGRSVQQDALALNDYNDITLNANGIAAISQTSITKFGAQYGWFFDNTTTGITWASNGLQSVAVRSADTAGTTSDPALIVVHSGATARRIINVQ